MRIANIQINTQNDMQANIKKANDLIDIAANEKADLIALPENASFMAGNPQELFDNSYFTKEHPALNSFKEKASQLKKWILIGSLSIKDKESGKLINRSVLIDDKGSINSQYDKIHLYDAQVKNGESHRESDRYIAGTKAVIAATPWCKTGMTICYDLRFPHLYRHLAKSGAKVIFVPAAFTEFTGVAHWEVLLRARAIENGCYIVAPAQTGSHPANRKTYGHSLIIDPWGEIISDAGREKGVSTVDIDLEKVDKIRSQLPSLTHDVDFDL